MAVSRFGLLCIAAVVAGGATAGLADSDTASVPVQVTVEQRGTPIAAIADPDSSFRDVAVQFTSGKTFGHVVAVSTNGEGRATKVRVALDDMPSAKIWLDQADLVYSRARDVIIAHDIHAPNLAVADAH